MSLMTDYFENALDELIDVADRYDENAPFADRLEDYRVYCLLMKMMGTARLLSFGDHHYFYKLFMSIAFNGLHFLINAKGENKSEYVPVSMSDPFYCAMICNRLDVARRIADFSANTIVQPEYDDEFYRVKFLHDYLLKGASDKKQKDHLENMCLETEGYLEETPVFVDFFRALITEDEKEIISAFKVWNEDAADGLIESANRFGAAYSLGVMQHLWVEGFAVLRLLTHMGYQVPGSFDLIPFIAVKPPSQTFDEKFGILGSALIETEMFYE